MSGVDECEFASDCTLEIGDREVIRECRKESFCECSSYFGFLGELCDEPSRQTQLLMIVELLTIIFSILAAIFLIYVFYQLRRFKRMVNVRHSVRQEPQRFFGFTLIFGFISLILEVVSSLDILLALLDPSKISIISIVYQGEQYEFVRGPLNYGRIVINGFSQYFLGIMMATMMFYWLNKLYKIRIALEGQLLNRLLRFQSISKAILAILSLALFACLWLKAISLLNIIAFGLSLTITILCWFARRLFLSALKFMIDGKNASKMTNLIRRFSWHYVILLSFYSGSFLLIAIGLIYLDDTTTAGDINFVLNFLESLALFKVFIIVYTLRFILKIIRKSKSLLRTF